MPAIPKACAKADSSGIPTRLEYHLTIRGCDAAMVIHRNDAVGADADQVRAMLRYGAKRIVDQTGGGAFYCALMAKRGHLRRASASKSMKRPQSIAQGRRTA